MHGRALNTQEDRARVRPLDPLLDSKNRVVALLFPLIGPTDTGLSDAQFVAILAARFAAAAKAE